MTVHGSFSSIETHERFDFVQTSGGSVIINRYGLHWQGAVKVVNSEVYSLMNRFSPYRCFWSQSVSPTIYPIGFRV